MAIVARCFKGDLKLRVGPRAISMKANTYRPNEELRGGGTKPEGR
jgi:hypothetical protein